MTGTQVIVNPTSFAAAGAIAAIRKTAEQLGMPEPRIIATSAREHGREQAAAVLAAGGRRILVVGGDGTIREVASAIAGTEATLGIVPAGTANLFARNLGLPLRSTARAARIALTAEARAIDLGRVRLDAPGRAAAEHVFLVVTGIGHDAEAVQASNVARKRRLGWLAYVQQGVKRFPAPPIPMRARLDDRDVVRTEAWSLLVHNSARIPVGLRVIPGTALDDGTLHVAVVSPRRLSHWGRIALSGMGLARAEGILRYRSAKRLEVQTETPQTVQIDGDPFGQVRGFSAWIDPGAILVRAPKPKKDGA